MTLTFPLFAAEAGRTVFPDVPESHWAAEKIKILSDKKWISGYDDSLFRPGHPVTRAELAAMIVNAAGMELSDPVPSFYDVKQDAWFYSSVESAKEFFAADPSLSINLFRPYDCVTRQEAVSAIVLAQKINLAAASPAALQVFFSDYDSISPAYRTIISWAATSGLVKGYRDGTFRPHLLLTRAEAAGLICDAFANQTTIGIMLKTGVIKSFNQSAEGFTALADTLQSRFGYLDGIAIKYYGKEISVAGNKIIYIFARVDPFSYFSFYDRIFKPNPGNIKQYAEKAAVETSRTCPGRLIIVMVGFTNLAFYSTAPDIYGREYTSFSPPEGGWRIERFYAGALSQDGKTVETWVEPEGI
jgi:hypothetical protein